MIVVCGLQGVGKSTWIATQRPQRKKVPEKSILSVHSLLEPPTIKEGFGSVRIIDVANPSDHGTKYHAGRAMAGGI